MLTPVPTEILNIPAESPGASLAPITDNGASTVSAVTIKNDGNVGIGTTSPGARLEVVGDTTHATIAKFTDATDTTSCTLSTGGLIACSSDIRLKKNIEDITYGLSTIMGLRPVLYNWNSEADGSMKNLGFIAQEVEALMPKLISTDDNGMKSLNSIGMIPVLTKAIQEMNLNLEGVADTVTPVPGSAAEGFVTAFINNIYSKITTWLANAGNGIGDIFANVFNAKEKICVDGECLTKDDIHALLLLARPPTSSSSSTTPPPAPDSSPTSEPSLQPTLDPAPAQDPAPTDPVVVDSAPVQNTTTVTASEPTATSAAGSPDPAPDPAPIETPSP